MEEFFFLDLVLKVLLKQDEDLILNAFKVEGETEMIRRQNFFYELREYQLTTQRLSPTAPDIPFENMENKRKNSNYRPSLEIEIENKIQDLIHKF